MKQTMFLNTEDYDFTPYAHEGFSGKLYLATPKAGKLPKLIVKHENPCSACNEFMYSRLAGLLHIPVPDAYLFRIAEKDQRLFATPYVVGLEYIEGLHSFTAADVTVNDYPYFDYVSQYALAVMFSQSDSVQLSMTETGRIIGMDFTECFRLEDITLKTLEMDRAFGFELLKNNLGGFMMSDFRIDALAGAKVIADFMGMEDVEAVYPAYHQPMKRFCKIPETQLRKLIEAIEEAYSPMIAAYFMEYCSSLKDLIEDYIPHAGHYRPLEAVHAALPREYWEDYIAFLGSVREEFGSKGAVEAKLFMNDTLEEYRDPNISLVDLEPVMRAMQEAFLTSKREAREKFTPKKYRKEQSCDEV